MVYFTFIFYRFVLAPSFCRPTWHICELVSTSCWQWQHLYLPSAPCYKENNWQLRIRWLKNKVSWQFPKQLTGRWIPEHHSWVLDHVWLIISMTKEEALNPLLQWCQYLIFQPVKIMNLVPPNYLYDIYGVETIHLMEKWLVL